MSRSQPSANQQLPDSSCSTRPDLSKNALLLLLALATTSFVVILPLAWELRPGAPLPQMAAIIGSLLLLVPFLFSLLKRSGGSQNPPFWFVVHVLSSTAGSALIFFHAAGGDWLSPPGLVLLALLFLVVQGILSRALIAPMISHLFAGSVSSFNFTQSIQIDRGRLARIIEAKIALLKRLDPEADEALFSPRFKHWARSPWGTCQYQRLIRGEAKLVGARRRAGPLLALWRRLHLLVAALFLLGLLAHGVTVLLFAGYAAGGDEIYWWHLTAWGGAS
jgi:hypothetical protein